MRKIFVLFFLINTTSFLGQVSGYILSSDTRKPIPYASLCNAEGGVVAYADEHGKFELTDLKFSKLLVVTSIGYEREELTVDKIPDTIFLSPKIINLAEVIILKKKNTKSVRVGTTEGKIALINDFTELPKAGLWTVAKYFPPDRLYEEMPFLKKVKIRTYCDVSDTFFTIRFYSKGESDMPDGLLYDKNITEEVKKGDRILTFDVSNLNIVLPSDGFFVAVERMLPEGEEKRTLENGRVISAKTIGGPGLITVKNENASDTSMTIKGTWTQWKKISAAIQIEVTN